MRVLSRTPPSEKFAGITNSDLAFTGPYAIQGNYNGYQVWDISNPAHPTLKTAYYCPASQSDVSVYKNLLFVSGEGISGRLDCGGEGREGHGEQGTPPRHSHLRHQRHRQPEVTSPTCRRAAARTRTRLSSIRRTRTTSTSTSRAPPASARRTSLPAARAPRRTRIRTPRSSASRSSRCRSRIRSRPRS